MGSISISTPDFFGIGEFWSGLILGLILFPTGFVLWFFFEDLLLPSGNFEMEPDEARLDGPAGAGVLVCDYVDKEMLQTIAQQKEIAPRPKESERGKEVTIEGSVGLQRIPIVGRLLRRTRENEKQRFEHREDHNVLLATVMDALEKDNELLRGLDKKPNVSLGSSRVMDELAGMAERHSEAKTAREALTAVTSRLMAEQKRAEFEDAAESGSFVLVEGPWGTERDGDGTKLSLRKLSPGRVLYGPDDLEPVDVPDGIALEVRVPDQGLSSQGRDRLSADEQTAAIFGTAIRASGGVSLSRRLRFLADTASRAPQIGA